MDWSAPIDLYCERTGPSFWAEPVDALTNAAFLIAAGAAYLQWRRNGGRDTPALLLILLTAVIGVGSFGFHTLATRGAVLLDTVPIAVFIYSYLFVALRRFVGLGTGAALAVLLGFAIVAFGETAIVPPATLNGSHAYLPAFAAMLVIGVLMWGRAAGPWIIAATACFAVSLVFRSLDLVVCADWPIGTHFIWHIANAAVLYLLLRAVLTDAAKNGP